MSYICNIELSKISKLGLPQGATSNTTPFNVYYINGLSKWVQKIEGIKVSVFADMIWTSANNKNTNQKASLERTTNGAVNELKTQHE